MRTPLEEGHEGRAPKLTLRIAPTDLVRLDQAARRNGVVRSVAVREALSDWLDRGEAVTA